MSELFKTFNEAQRVGDGNLLASCLAPIGSGRDPDRLAALAGLTNFQNAQSDIRYHLFGGQHTVKLPKNESNQWVEIFVALWKCARELFLIEKNGQGNWDLAFKAYKDVCTFLNRGYSNYGFQAWTIPCMYTAGKYLRLIAIRADEAAAYSSPNGLGLVGNLADDMAEEGASNAKLQDAARTLQQMISVCRSDDSDLTESRKWGVISMANLLFKTYFKLNNLALTRNVIAILESPGVNLPPLAAFPQSHQCTYSYYRGVLDFLREDYATAHEYLESALSMCPVRATRNREQILTYLIPTTMLTRQNLPTEQLLSQAPTLRVLLHPICKAIRTGNLADFDRALALAEVELIHRRIYLTLERLRDLCMRNLFRKVFIIAGYEESKGPPTDDATTQTKRTRLEISEFEAAVKVALRKSDQPVVIDRDEVECYLANMIYKGYMKAYIAREQGKVVLSKGGAFPGTGV